MLSDVSRVLVVVGIGFLVRGAMGVAMDWSGKDMESGKLAGWMEREIGSGTRILLCPTRLHGIEQQQCFFTSDAQGSFKGIKRGFVDVAVL